MFDVEIVCGLFALVSLSTAMLPLIPRYVQKFPDEERDPTMAKVVRGKRLKVLLLNGGPLGAEAALDEGMPPDDVLVS